MYLCVYVCFFWLAHLLELLLLLLFFLLFWFSSLCLDIFTVGPHCVSCIKGLNPAYWVRSTLAAACQTSQHVITATINRHTHTHKHTKAHSTHTVRMKCTHTRLRVMAFYWQHFIRNAWVARNVLFFAIALFYSEGRLMTLSYSNKARQTRISLCHKNYNNRNNRLICQYAYETRQILMNVSHLNLHIMLATNFTICWHKIYYISNFKAVY